MEQLTPNFIEKKNSDEPAENFDLLVHQGIDLLQKLTGNTWTDYNVHDPGVTILEQLCFAFTDLAYRTGFPIEDILTDKIGEIDKLQHSFFDREKILSANPVTVNDFKKVILDEVEEIDNVQIVPLFSDFSEGYVKGLYKIYVRVSDMVAERFLKEPALESEIADKVKKVFLSKRNLCEDVWDVVVLKPQVITLKADVIVKEFIQPEVILLEIYNKIQSVFSPKVRFYTEPELLKKGLKQEEIYSGPFLKHGIVPDSELKPLITEIDTFELIRTITTAKGVLLVQKLSINEQTEEDFGKPFKLQKNSFPLLNIDSLWQNIQLFTGEYRLNTRKKDFFDLQEKSEKVQAEERKLSLRPELSDKLKKGTYRNIGKYYSLQNNFPAIYGLGEFGVPPHEPNARKGQVKQLKAYLVFFEQILADYLAQLSSLSQLFSTEFIEGQERSYYYTPLYDVPAIKDILFKEEATEREWEEFKADKNNPYVKTLTESQEDVSKYRERKHRVFEHLYARFNKKFSTYPVLLFLDFYGDADDGKTGMLLKWKAEILRNLPESGYNRIKAFNYLEKTYEVSGFEKRILALLHIKDQKRKRLSAAFEGGKIAFVSEKEENHITKLNEDVVKTANWSNEELKVIADVDDIIELSQIGKLLAGGINQKESFLFRKQGFSVLKHGINIENYRVIPSVNNEDEFIIIYKDPAKELWKIISRHNDRPSALIALRKLVTFLRKLSVESEGFHVVEHILLRPSVQSDAFGFRFYRNKKEVIFENNEWTDFEQREKIIGQILNFSPADETTQGVNEERRHTSGASFKIRSSERPDVGLVVNSLTKKVPGLDESDLSNAREEVSLFKHDKTLFYPRFEMLVKLPDNKILKEDFYSLRTTVVLPEWPARFQESEFRTYVEDLFKNSVPAYMRINFLWLSVAKMREFENLHFNWLDALKSGNHVSEISTKLTLWLAAEKFHTNLK